LTLFGSGEPGGLFEPPKRPPGGRLRQAALDKRAAKKGTRQCIFSGAGGPQKVKKQKNPGFSVKTGNYVSFFRRNKSTKI
jgi:hypothetical protein